MEKTFRFAALFCFVMPFSGATLADDLTKKEDQINYRKQAEWVVSAGLAQSPINILPAQSEPLRSAGAISVHYQPAALNEIDKAHGSRLAGAGKALINGREFNFSQLHFHARSEHSINGQYYPLEAHFVNQGQDGKLAVIAVFLVEGQSNLEFQSLLDYLAGTEQQLGQRTIAVDRLLPANFSYYHYNGSLTTPPLSENVEWYVLKQPVQLSAQQIAQFKQYNGANSRIRQPLNGRKVLEYVE